MSGFAGQPFLDVWYAHLDIEQAISKFRSQMKAKRFKAAEKLLTKAHTHDSTKALGKTRPDAGHRYAGRAPIFTQPTDGGIPAGSDLLFLVRVNGTLAPVTHTSTPAPKEGDPMILPGPAPAVS